MLTAVLAQVAPTAGQTRALGLAVLGVAFALRGFADTRNVLWLNWLSPLGLRALTRPFLDDNWWALAPAVAAAAGLAALATRLAAAREYGAGLIPRRDRRDARAPVRSGLGLIARLGNRSVLGWTLAVAALGTLFTAIGSGVVQQTKDGDLGGFLGSQLGTGDPVAGYFSYSGTVIGLLTCCFAVLTVLRSGHDERAGLTDHLLATGARRWAPLAWQVAFAGLGALAVLTVTGLLDALVAPAVVDGKDVSLRAFAYAVGQWPAALAAAGWTALLIGLRPRLAALAWVPLATSAVLALLGGLLGIPERVRELGVLQHMPDIVAPGPDLRQLVVLLAVAALACILGLAGAARRDVVIG